MRVPDLLSQPSRFAFWSARARAAVLALVGALMIWGLVAPGAPPRAAAPDPRAAPGAGHVPPVGNDVLLYQAMAGQVRQGADYYAATARLLRERDYPLRPFVTFRLPGLSWLLATLPHGVMVALMALLVGAVILAWTVRLAPALRTPQATSWASLLIMMNCLTAFSPRLIVFHEGWAALLVALSLALWRPDRWLPSALLALAAVLTRELALPFVLLMGGLALLGRRWREATGWAFVALLFAVALAFHARAVWAVTSLADPASPGWTSAGGWPFVTAAVQQATLFNLLPVAVTPVLLPLALLGWAAWASPTGTRAFLFIAGFAAAMMIFGRPDNFYWAVMITPLLFAGLIFAPAALRDLVASPGAPRARAA